MRKREKKQRKRLSLKTWVTILAIVALLGCAQEIEGKIKGEEQAVETGVVMENLETEDVLEGVNGAADLETPGELQKFSETQENDWERAFADAGFSGEEIERYREIIETVGVAEFHDVEIIENGIMHIIRGKIYDSSNLQLNVTLEDREIIYIELAGIPDVKNVPYINWRGKLKNKRVNTVTSVELYSDTEGGYEGVLVWKDKFIYPCDTSGNILEE